ncbi:MAG: sulfatase [Paludibacter sp.]|nr:sulfatase [Paludibacter sp.]
MNNSQVLYQKQFALSMACGLGFFSLSVLASNQTPTKKMNVVFILADDLRWNSLKCMGTDFLITPNIDALAKSGLRFSNAYVTTSISCVSRASILTGQYMSRHGITGFDKNITPQKAGQTYPGLLHNAGYWTGFVGKYGFGKGRVADFDYSAFTEELRHWLPVDPKTKIEELGGGYTRILGDSIHITEKNAQDAIRFLKTRPADKPFNLSVSFFATHADDGHPDQYRYQPQSEKYYQDITIPTSPTATEEALRALPPFISSEKNEGRTRWHWRFDTPEKYQKMMKAYFRLLTELDEVVGRIVVELKSEGVYENTLIVFNGDNGYFESDHQLADKWYPYEEALKVPLIIYDPRLPAKLRGKFVYDLALNVDIAPTILSAAGVAVSDSMQGADLSKLYLGKKTKKWRRDYFYEHPFIRDEVFIPSSQALVTLTDKYIIYPHYNYEEYFNLKNDPKETKNGISKPENQKKIIHLKKRFLGLKESAK